MRAGGPAAPVAVRRAARADGSDAAKARVGRRFAGPLTIRLREPLFAPPFTTTVPIFAAKSAKMGLSPLPLRGLGTVAFFLVDALDFARGV